MPVERAGGDDTLPSYAGILEFIRKLSENAMLFSGSKAKLYPCSFTLIGILAIICTYTSILQ
jgi:hypothetical protein